MKIFWLIFIIALCGCATRPPVDKPASKFAGQFMKLGANEIYFASNAKNVAATEIPTIYVHGLGGSLDDFSELIQAHHPVGTSRVYYAFDLPLFGKSKTSDTEFSTLKYSILLGQFIEQVAPAKVNLVCHSLGGQICIEYALKKPEQIQLLTLIAPAGVYDQATYLEKMLSHSKYEIPGPIEDLLLKTPDLSWYDQPLVQKVLSKSPAVLMAIGSFKENVREKVKHLKTKTLVIWGRNDDVFDFQNGSFLKENIKNSSLHIIDGAGHVPMKSHADQISRLIQDNLSF